MRTSSVDLIILETLSKEHAHLTSHEVYKHIRSQLPAVNASTVYRSLERLASTGKISVSDMGTGSEVYESLADGMHHHLICQSCGRVITIGHEEVKDFFTTIQQKNKFVIQTNHLILFGICEQCQAAEAREKQKS
jgi:Fur family transcriptional regulator, ferric uptake regulator